jgi:hypothetical protein
MPSDDELVKNSFLTPHPTHAKGTLTAKGLINEPLQRPGSIMIAKVVCVRKTTRGEEKVTRRSDEGYEGTS